MAVTTSAEATAPRSTLRPGSPRHPFRTALGPALAVTLLATMGFSTVAQAPAAASGGAVLVSPGDAAAVRPALSPDGNHVAFGTAAPLVADDDNGARDAYLSSADAAGSYAHPVLLSATPGGAAGDGASEDPAISADGHYAAFVSVAADLVPGDANGVADVFVRNTVLGSTVRVTGGPEPDGASGQPAISGDGRFVVFSSAAANLVADDTNGVRDVFLADLAADPVAVRRVSLGADGGELPGPSYDPAISPDGAFVSFTTETAGVDQTPSADPGQTYAWRVRRDGSGLSPVGRNRRGDQTGQTALAADGTVAFVSSMTEFRGVALGAAAPRVFVAGDGRWEWVSDGLEGSTVSGPVISADGATVAFVSGTGDAAEVRVARVESGHGDDVPGSSDGVPAPVAGPASSTAPAVSASGRTLALETRTDLGTGDGDTVEDIGVVVLPDVGEVSLHPTLDRAGGLPVPGPVRRIDPDDVPATALGAAEAALAGIGVKNIGVKNIGVKNIGVKNIGVKNIWVKNIGVKNIWIKNIGVKNIGVKNIATLLVGTPFEGVPIESVTFGQVMEWALANPEHPSAQVILSLTLADLDADGVLGRLSFAALLLLAVPVSDLRLPGPGTPLENWRAAAAAQGFDPDGVSADSTLLELELTGLDLGMTRAHEVVARDLPVAGSELAAVRLLDLHLPGTAVGDLRLSDLPAPEVFVDCGRTDCADGTLAGAGADGALLPDATLADLVPVLPPGIDLGDLLWTLLPPDAYPWESVTWADGRAARFATPPGATTVAVFRGSFDTGPGGAAYVEDAVLQVDLPAGTALVGYAVQGTGPHEYVAPFTKESVRHEDHGNRVLFHFGDVPSGSTFRLEATVSDAFVNDSGVPVRGLLRSLAGEDAASLDLRRFAAYDAAIDPPDNEDPETAPVLEERVITFGSIHEPDDVDYYRIPAPADGQVVVASVAASGGDLDTGVFRAEATGSGEPVGTGGAHGPVALLEEPRRGVAAGRLQPAPENLLAVPGHRLLAAGLHEGPQDEELRVMGDGGTEPLLIRVSSADGRTSAHPYLVRYRYQEAKPEQRCAPRTLSGQGTPGVLPELLPPGITTLVLVDARQIGDTYAPREDGLLGSLVDAGTWTVRELTRLDGTLGLKTVVLPVTGADLLHPLSPRNSRVVAARHALNQDPCNVGKSNELADAITELVHSYLTPTVRETLRSVVLVGGDDALPMHRVRQATFAINEEDNEASLRLQQVAEGQPCPVVTAGQLDPCATPLSAAAAGNYILTDDGYADLDPARLLGREVFVPDLAVGRLVETPDEIAAAVRTFLDQDGVLRADSALATGYDAWQEMPAEIARGLVGIAVERLEGDWTGAQLDAALFPAGASPRVVSPNAHASETHLLPGDPGDGFFTEDDLYGPGTMAGGDGSATSQDVAAIRHALAGVLTFTIGCHAGGGLPDVWYGDPATGGAGGRGALDWSQLLGQVGGYVANTGYGIADTAATGLSEQLMSDYAGHVGSGLRLTAGEALTLAKQDYWSDLGRYLGYDDKVLMQATYYGLPMWTIEDHRPSTAPTPGPTDAFGADLRATFTPSFVERQAADGSSYWTAGEVHVAPGHPILPRVTSTFAVPDGQHVHGAEIVGLESRSEPGRPTVADARVGAELPADRYDAIAFPTSFAHVTGEGRFTLTPARVEAESPGEATIGLTELFTRTEVRLHTSTDDGDYTAPEVRSEVAVAGDSVTFSMRKRDPAGEGSIVRATVLHQAEGATGWQLLELADGDGDGVFTGSVPSGRLRAIFQAVDEHGNVRVDTDRGRLNPAPVGQAPVFDPGGSAEVAEGQPFVRLVGVDDPDSDRGFTATVDTGQGPLPADVVLGPDGTWRIEVLVGGLAPGTWPVQLRVCDDTGLCAEGSFDLTVLGGNTAPQAHVEIHDAATGAPLATARDDQVLRAVASATDADGDDVALAYTWWVEGQPVGEGPELDLAGVAAVDDEVAVTVVPTDEHGLGGGSSAAWVIVVPDAPPTVDAGGDALVPEGSTYTATGHAADPEGDPLAGTVDYGDGSTVEELAIAADGTFDLAHAYADDGTHLVTVSVTARGASASDTALVTVENVAPGVLDPDEPLAPVPVGSTVTVAIAWTDPGADTHVVVVDWGDGATSTLSPTAGLRLVQAEHTYQAAGTWPVSVTVTDDDGGIGESSPWDYAVVYDPDSAVTANGFFTSPEGAWAEQPAATGQAEFGTNVAYGEDDQPTGKARFTFDVNPDDRGCQVQSCLQFDSGVLDSLVVADRVATLRGSGTLLGRQGTFRFLLAMADGDPDRVRMRITKGRTVVYDSGLDAPESAPPDLPLGGGTVVIK